MLINSRVDSLSPTRIVLGEIATIRFAPFVNYTR
jgi:hypothetical protein